VHLRVSGQEAQGKEGDEAEAQETETETETETAEIK